MTTHKTDWKDDEIVYPEDLNRIENNNKENTEQLLSIEQNIELKENQISTNIKKIQNLDGYGLKYLTRKDAEIGYSKKFDSGNKIIDCPSDKLMYVLSTQVTKSSRFTLVDINNKTTNYETPHTASTQASSYFTNILFESMNPILVERGLTLTSVDIEKFSMIQLLPLSKIILYGSSQDDGTAVTYLLLDKDKGGIDYSDFN